MLEARALDSSRSALTPGSGSRRGSNRGPLPESEGGNIRPSTSGSALPGMGGGLDGGTAGVDLLPRSVPSMAERARPASTPSPGARKRGVVRGSVARHRADVAKVNASWAREGFDASKPFSMYGPLL